jgi:hypothetical protein
VQTAARLAKASRAVPAIRHALDRETCGNKSFLVLFFKKEPLPSFVFPHNPVAAPAQPKVFCFFSSEKKTFLLISYGVNEKIVPPPP